MDIDLFSDIVKSLVLDNDEVTLPGLGTFVSELMPSSFSDKGYTINPPYRRLSFRQRWDEQDTLLQDFYSRTNGIDSRVARQIIDEFLSGLKEILQTKKLVVLPGLGRLRATKENTFFFIADEDLDIYPYGFGLEAVSLKTHEETPEEIETVVKDLKEVIDTPVAETKPSVTITVPVEQDAPVVRKRRPWVVAAAVIACVALLSLGAFALLGRIAPAVVDKWLYTPEELEIINYPESDV